MLCQYPRQIESDLLRVFGIDVVHLGRGLTWRRLGVLLTTLPGDSLLASAMSADADPTVLTDAEESRMWRLEHHLLAQVIDLLAAANWQRGGGKGRRPQPLDRPGNRAREQVIKRKSTLTIEQKIAALKSLGPPKEGDGNGR